MNQEKKTVKKKRRRTSTKQTTITNKTPDRLNYSYGMKFNLGNYETGNVQVTYGSDVRPDETLSECFERLTKLVWNKVNKEVATHNKKDEPATNGDTILDKVNKAFPESKVIDDTTLNGGRDIDRLINEIKYMLDDKRLPEHKWESANNYFNENMLVQGKMVMLHKRLNDIIKELK